MHRPPPGRHGRDRGSHFHHTGFTFSPASLARQSALGLSSFPKLSRDINFPKLASRLHHRDHDHDRHRHREPLPPPLSSLLFLRLDSVVAPRGRTSENCRNQNSLRMPREPEPRKPEIPESLTADAVSAVTRALARDSDSLLSSTIYPNC